MPASHACDAGGASHTLVSPSGRVCCRVDMALHERTVPVQGPSEDVEQSASIMRSRMVLTLSIPAPPPNSKPNAPAAFAAQYAQSAQSAQAAAGVHMCVPTRILCARDYYHEMMMGSCRPSDSLRILPTVTPLIVYRRFT